MENASPPNNQIRLLSQGHAQPPRCPTARGEDRRSAEGCVRLKKEDLPALLPKILPGAESRSLIVWSRKVGASLVPSAGSRLRSKQAKSSSSREATRMSRRAARACAPIRLAPGVIDAATRGQLPFCINFGGDEADLCQACLRLPACDAQPFNPLLENLPPVIKAGDRKDCNAGSGWPIGPSGDDGVRPTSAPAVKAFSRD